jgi:pilus assembly protein Flp/PilA
MTPRLRMSLPRPCWQFARALQTDETGATAVEYGLIAALVVLAILSALKGLGADLAGLPLGSIVTALQSVL